MPCRKCGKVMFRHRSMMKRHVVCFDCKMARQKQQRLYGFLSTHQLKQFRTKRRRKCALSIE